MIFKNVEIRKCFSSWLLSHVHVIYKGNTEPVDQEMIITKMPKYVCSVAKNYSREV